MSIDSAQYSYDMQTPGDRDLAMRVAPKMTSDERLKDERWQARRAFFRTTGSLWTCALPTPSLWDIAIDPWLRMNLGPDLKQDIRDVIEALRRRADELEAVL
jgi:hypothetical protein